ncbi:MAG: NAD(+) synthase [Dysgonamonadaceae bacterium]|nr:NAD(+) synthase [Dysgonamonadaceae bacterium]MDD3310047.1 NAD(+) synthase [Dysgonamonadaceae bacterium]MDD3901335.1 NAD(+) synthase [Dysgonamonadaceae bacterium]MDD4400119.1 NAD(+) synthase [Dysgonamonadaceae bacterium]
MDINQYGFLRVAASTPKVKVADCEYNIREIQSVIKEASDKSVQILCFPELCITGYTCGDLFFQRALQKKAIESLFDIAHFMTDYSSVIVIVGLPLFHKNGLYNVAAVINSEGIKGFVAKKNIPNSKEFYEKRWFLSGDKLNDFTVELAGQEIPISSASPIFTTPFGNFAIEICEDLWMPIPPSCTSSVLGADVIFNLSASNDIVGKNNYRRNLILQQSARCVAGYVYASSGVGESSTDVVFSGADFIAENGVLLKESERFSFDNQLIISDIDLNILHHDRMVNTNYLNSKELIDEIYCHISPISFNEIYRSFNPHPFIPTEKKADENLNEVFSIQTHGLAKRLIHTGIQKVTIGISGGLDSTLALLVTIKTFDILGLSRGNIYGITMPGFGTTDRTYNNAIELMKSAGVTIKEIPIVNAVSQHFKDIDHDINNHDITYENGQARERTQILMDYANKINGLVIGTGNLSELALGWATYNGDHMSMYGVNTSVPKTLVKSLVRWIANTQMDEKSKIILDDILDTPYSPELLPANSDGDIEQRTEDKIGPYELHDFFLYRMLRYGDEPTRIYFIAKQAFNKLYSPEIILKWLTVFYKRFFSQQFKRSCMPDGPKVGSVNLSPRGDWRMPSDAAVTVWLDQLNKIKAN